MLDPTLRDQMLSAVPSLRAFAISLSGNVDRADDLVQETLLRAIANIESFQPGTNMSAWLFTILRNLFRSEYRKRRREVEDTDGSYAETLKSHPEQSSRLEFNEFRQALAKLPQDQREALILVGASGSASARSVPSRAASTARATVWPICWRSKAPTTSGRTTRPVRFSRRAAGAVSTVSNTLL
jgi:RNA polymerase sigma factor (sigma-70 family)